MNQRQKTAVAEKGTKYLAQFISKKEVDRENYRIRFVMSTPEVDRHGEIIDQRGWNFNNYMKNPVVLWGHDQSVPAVGKVVLIENVNGSTEGVVQFAVKENPDAKVLFDLYAEGFMNAVSVGFLNLKWMYDEVKDIVTLLENELYELSLVNVPANAAALSKARMKGIDVSIIDKLNKTRDFEKEGYSNGQFKDLGEKVDEEDLHVDIDEEDPEELDEETAAPSKTDDEVTPNGDDEVKSALEVLFKADKSTIKASVKALESRLNDAQVEEKAKEATDTKKGLSNKHINRLISSLLGSKSTHAGNL